MKARRVRPPISRSRSRAPSGRPADRADLRKPDQHRLFGTTLEGGLSELILKTPTAARVQMNGFRSTNFANLSLLTSGTVPPNPAELLASKRAMALLDSIGPTRT